MFLRELTGRRDWSDENLAFGIESFELFVYARVRCIECSRSWQSTAGCKRCDSPELGSLGVLENFGDQGN